jgi:hypothetical protein
VIEYVPGVEADALIAPLVASIETPGGALKLPPLVPVITGAIEPLFVQNGEV